MLSIILCYLHVTWPGKRHVDLNRQCDHAPHAVGEAGHRLPDPLGIADHHQLRPLQPVLVSQQCIFEPDTACDSTQSPSSRSYSGASPHTILADLENVIAHNTRQRVYNHQAYTYRRHAIAVFSEPLEPGRPIMLFIHKAAHRQHHNIHRVHLASKFAETGNWRYC